MTRTFEIHNASGSELELFAIEQDVYTDDGSLLQRRTVNEASHMKPDARLTLRDPMPELDFDIPRVTLFYRLGFRTPAGRTWEVGIPVAPA